MAQDPVLNPLGNASRNCAVVVPVPRPLAVVACPVVTVSQYVLVTAGAPKTRPMTPPRCAPASPVTRPAPYVCVMVPFWSTPMRAATPAVVPPCVGPVAYERVIVPMFVPTRPPTPELTPPVTAPVA